MKLESKFNIVIIAILTLFLTVEKLHSQNPPEDYFDKTSPFSRLGSGESEPYYNPRIYKGHPYYGSENYVNGSVVFNNVKYTNQTMRLDLYKQQLVVLSSVNRALVMPCSKIQMIEIHNKIFVWLDPEKTPGLRNKGFYISYFTGKKVELFSQESISVIDEKVTPRVFESKPKYYLKVDGIFHQIKGKGDFLKLFAAGKKRINQYSKDNKLDFTANKIESMTTLAAFCDTL